IPSAIKYYQAAIDANPNDKALYLNLTQIYVGQNNFPQALIYAEKAKQKFPTDSQINNLYNTVKSSMANNIYAEADKLREKGNYTEALAKYKSIQPQGFNSYLGIAGIYQLMKDYPNAVLYYKKALETEPNNQDVLLALTGIYIYQNDIQNADLTLRKITNKQNPKVEEMAAYINEQKSNIELNKAIEKYENKEYAAAQTILNSLINQKTGGYLPYYYRAMVYDAQGKYKEAVTDYESVIAKDPTIALVYYSLGVDYDSLKNFPRAIQNYKKFLELSTENNDYTRYARERIKQSQ
ncbi:MAG: tetratricopeptide repeat protein, partial [Candidatus Gastranaerophilaceae bacterium]